MTTKESDSPQVPLVLLKLPKKINYILLGLVFLSLLSVFDSYLSNCQGIVLNALLVNFTFFGGLATGLYSFAMFFLLTGVKWGIPYKRMAESGLIFLPVIFVLLLILLWFDFSLLDLQAARKIDLFTSTWFGDWVTVFRNIILFSGFLGFASLYSHSSFHWERLRMENKTEGWLYSFYRKIRQSKLVSILILVLFIITVTNWSIDWIMAIDHHWNSTLLGLHYAVSSLLSAGAFLIIFSAFLKQKLKVNHFLAPENFNALIVVTCVLGLIWFYFVFSQILVIWYGNIPHEAEFLALRLMISPWKVLSIIVFFTLFTLPFLGLILPNKGKSLGRYRKMSFLILIGVWLEKYLMIIPSLKTNQSFIKLIGDQTDPSGYLIIEIMMTLGLVALFIFLVFNYFRFVPVFERFNPDLNLRGNKN